MSERNLGDLGESTLRVLAAQVGAPINPAFQDRRGWDFLVEFQRDENDFWPSLDVRPPEIQCLIQVKSTASDETRLSVPLSNWERLAKSPLPAFFLVLRFSQSTDDVEFAHLVHVGEYWIGKVLERLREETLKGSTNLARKTLDLVWTEDTVLSDLSGLALQNAVRSDVGSSMSEYSSNKARLLEELGDPVKAVMSFVKTAKSRSDLLEEWVDLAIGIRNSIEVSRFELKKDVRFGIPTAVVSHEGGELRIINRSKEGLDINLVVRNNQVSRSSKFEAKLYTPHHFFPSDPVPEEFYKARIVFSIGEVIVRPYDRSIRLNFDFSTVPNQAQLQVYGEIFRLAHILSSVSTEGCTISLFKSGESPSEFPLESSIVGPIDQNILWLSMVVSNALFVASFLGVPDSTNLALSQLVEQAELFQQARAFCDPNLPIGKVAGIMKGDVVFSEGEQAIALVKRIKYSDSAILISVGLAGPTRVSKDEHGQTLFEVAQPRTLFVKPRMEQTDDESAKLLLDETVEYLEAEGFGVIRLDDPYDNAVGG